MTVPIDRPEITRTPCTAYCPGIPAEGAGTDQDPFSQQQLMVNAGWIIPTPNEPVAELVLPDDSEPVA